GDTGEFEAIDDDSCPSVLTRGESCRLETAFAPTTVGDKQLTVTARTSAGDLVATLTGRATQAQPVETVTNLDPEGPGAFAQAVDFVAPGGTVEFAPSVTGTIAPSHGLSIAKAITIDGPGARDLVVSGVGKPSSEPLFSVAPGAGEDVTIEGLTIADSE